MKTKFKELSNYIKLHNGMNKPKLNFQELYRLFPQFTFATDKDFGSYVNFGEAYEAKILNMIAIDGKDECYIAYKEYGDANENMAYAYCI